MLSALPRAVSESLPKGSTMPTTRTLLLLTPALLGASLAGLPGTAAGATQAVCRFTMDESVTPGLTLSGSTGSYATRAPANVTCTGRVDGQEPTGAGTYEHRGRYGTLDPDDCLSGGEGDGEFTLKIPTAAGIRTIRRPFTFTFGGPSTRGGVVAGDFGGQGFVGSFDIVPTEATASPNRSLGSRPLPASPSSRRESE